MSDTTHTLDDLVRLTGFSKRQIRFYITKKLVEGAGESRGPGAVYSDETLRRLQAIARLKDHRIQPTGRRMTLDEIGLALETLGPDGTEALIAGTEVLKLLDTEDEGPPARPEADAGELPAPDSAYQYLASLRSSGIAASRADRADVARRDDHYRHRARGDPPNSPTSPLLSSTFWSDAPDPAADLRDLLGRLQALLAELGGDARQITTGDAEQWRRLTDELVEIQVRQPTNHHTRLRLAGLARALQELLDSGEDRS